MPLGRGCEASRRFAWEVRSKIALCQAVGMATGLDCGHAKAAEAPRVEAGAGQTWTGTTRRGDETGMEVGSTGTTKRREAGMWIGSSGTERRRETTLVITGRTEAGADQGQGHARLICLSIPTDSAE